MEKKIYEKLVQIKGYEHIIESDLAIKQIQTGVIAIKPYSEKTEKSFNSWVEVNSRDWAFPTIADIDELVANNNLETKLKDEVVSNPIEVSESETNKEVPIVEDLKVEAPTEKKKGGRPKKNN